MMSIPLEPFRKILVATDFSDNARAAFTQGMWLGETFGGEVTLAHVLTNLRQAIAALPYSARWELIFGDIDVFERAVRAESQARLNSMVEPFRSRCSSIKVETLLGKPALALIHAVQSEGHEVVVVGTRGMSAMKQFLMGSTSRQLIRECPAAVWVTKDGGHWPPRRILVAVDFSELSLRALQQASHLAKSAGAILDVLHVIEMSEVLSDFGAVPRPNVRDSEVGRDIENQAHERLKTLTSSAGLLPDRVALHVEWGAAGELIVSNSRLWQNDLIVMGTCGRVGIAGFMVGNTAEQVLQDCDCSVLTVKPAGFVSRIDPPAWELHPTDLPAGH